MPAERYYFPDRFELQQPIIFKEQEFHHLAHVMRGRIGDKIEMVNGLGQLANGVITSLTKREATIAIETVTVETPPTKALILAQAMPQMNHLEFIIEKATELGMTELRLFPGARSGRKQLTESQKERLIAIAIAAMKQCGRLYIPTLHFNYPAIQQWQGLPKPTFFGDVNPDAVPLIVERQKHSLQEVMFCVGPESGFTSEEIDYLKQNGAIGVSLHHNILRTETAAIAALAILSQGN